MISWKLEENLIERDFYIFLLVFLSKEFFVKFRYSVMAYMAADPEKITKQYVRLFPILKSFPDFPQYLHFKIFFVKM